MSATSDRLRELEETFEALKALILDSNYDEYGGFVPLKGQNTGFFHVEKMNGKFWLIDPEGSLFISKGVNHVNYWSDYSLIEVSASHSPNSGGRRTRSQSFRLEAQKNVPRLLEACLFIDFSRRQIVPGNPKQRFLPKPYQLSN